MQETEVRGPHQAYRRRALMVIGRRLVASPLFALAGMLLIVWGQWRWLAAVDAPGAGAFPVVLGMLLVMISPIALMASRHRLFDRPTRPTRPGLWQIPLALAGIALVSYTAWRAFPDELPVWDVLLLWGAGVLLVFAGCVPFAAFARWGRMVWRSVRNEPLTWTLLGVLFGVGLLVRVAWLDSAPPILAGDEAQFAQEAVNLKDFLRWKYNPFQLGLWHHPRLYHTLIAVSISIFGQTAAAVRLPAAIFGALTVPALYLLGRRMFDTRIGWIAALFIVTFPFHVQFSRTGMDMTGDPLFVALAFALLVRALRESDRFEAGLAGIALGLSQYFYFAGRIAIVLIAILIVLYALHDWRGVLRRLPVLATTGLLALVVAGPLLYAMLRDTSRPLNPRLAHVSIWETGALETAYDEGRAANYLSDQVVRGFLAYVHFQDESDVFGRYSPVLGWYAGVPFLIGAAALLRHWRDPRTLTILLWPAGTALAGGTLLIDPPHFPRYVSATPALAIIVAAGVVWGAGVLSGGIAVVVQRWPSVRHSAGMLRGEIGFVLVMLLAAANLLSYTFRYMPRTGELLYGLATQRLNAVVRVLDDLGGRYQVVRFSSLYLDMDGTDVIRYLTPENAGFEYRGAVADWHETLEPGPHAFVVAPARYDEVVPALAREFPGGDLEIYFEPGSDEPLVYVYFVDVLGENNDG